MNVGLGVGLVHAVAVHQDALRPVDELAGLEALDHVGDLGLEGHDLLVAAEGDLDRGQQVVRGERLDDVRHRARLARALDELSTRRAAQEVLEVGWAANALIEKAPPFKTIKDDPDRAVRAAVAMQRAIAVLPLPGGP